MEDTFVRKDLLRLGILLVVITGIMVGLKIYDHSTNAVADFGAEIFDGIIAK